MDDTTKKKEKKHGGLSLDGSSHQTGDAAFTSATPQDLQHSRANTDSTRPKIDAGDASLLMGSIN
jgi:hypothetical protein